MLWGMATLSNQAALLICMDQKEVKEAELMWEEAIPVLGNQMMPVVGNTKYPSNTLALDPLLGGFCDKGHTNVTVDGLQSLKQDMS